MIYYLILVYAQDTFLFLNLSLKNKIKHTELDLKEINEIQYMI